MIIKIAEFKVKREKLHICLTAISKFVGNVHEKESDTLAYDAYQKEDGISFIHFMNFKDEKAEAHHRKTAYVKRFVEILYPNCEIPPVFTDLTPVVKTR